MTDKISTGNDKLDEFLGGGYDTDIITTVYGPSGSGKTNIMMLAMVSAAKSGKKVIYMDTEGGFSIERMQQMADNYKELLDHVIFLRPTNFEEQMEAFEKLKKIAPLKIGLVIVDTISMLYRLKLGKNQEVYEVNRELGRQLSNLVEMARKHNIPVLLANQVYSNFDERDKVNMVGGDILNYASKCLIELQITPDGKRRAILKKHRFLSQEKDFIFEIVNEGIRPSKESFKLF